MAITIDRQAVGRGMAVYLGIAAPCGLLIALAHGSDSTGHESNWWVAAFLMVFAVAPFVAGVVAGGWQNSPLLHGAVAVAAPAGLFLLIVSIVHGVKGTLSSEEILTFLLYLAVFTSLGMLGGYVAFRRRQRLA
jgi:peptidoglycan/LPS O-acetylase OafA/YrhL